MKSALLISIHPEYVDKILSGEKRFEYRRRRPKADISHLVIYATSPIKRIVAIAEVESVISGSPSSLWEKTKYAAGISRSAFRVYFRGRNIGNAFKLGRVFRIDSAISSQMIFTPPQSFAYLPQDSIKKLSHSLK